MTPLIRIFTAIILFVSSMFCTSAFAEKRVALVIGNSAYTEGQALKNPLNDATDIAASLKRLGFDVVLGLDLDYSGMRKTIGKFSGKLNDADVAMFYYAGHALQVNGINYLAPVDTKLEQESDLDFETVSLELIQRQMAKNAKTLLVFLDACRDNPLTRRFVRITRSSSTGNGLARPASSPEGEFIAFSTQPGNVALDGDGRNSPFTTALLNNIERPGLEISSLMTSVRKEVYDATKQQQLPWTNSALLGHFFFNTKIIENNSAKALKQFQLETAEWEKIKDSQSPENIRQFLSKFESGSYNAIANQALNLLLAKSTKVKLNIPRKKEVKTALLVDPEDSLRSQEKETGTVSPSRSLVRSIQQELSRIGCDAGNDDGIWGKKGRAALRKYAQFAKLQYSGLELEQELLVKLETHQSRICPLVCGVRFYQVENQCVLKKCTSGKRLSSKGLCYLPSIVKKKKPVSTKRKATRVSSKKKITRKRRVVKRKSSGRNCFKFNGALVCE